MSVPGNLFASVLVSPRAGEGPAQLLSFVAALALDKALGDYVARERLALKWPNDVLLDDVKVAGILLEVAGGGTIIGFGVNLAGHPHDLDRTATSLAAAGVEPPAPAAFLDRLVDAFDDQRTRWRTDGFPAVRRRWLERAAGRGARLEARLGAETVTGVFDDLAGDGALVLRLDDGSIRHIHAGEVFRL